MCVEYVHLHHQSSSFNDLIWKSFIEAWHKIFYFANANCKYACMANLTSSISTSVESGDRKDVSLLLN